MKSGPKIVSRGREVPPLAVPAWQADQYLFTQHDLIMCTMCGVILLQAGPGQPPDVWLQLMERCVDESWDPALRATILRDMAQQLSDQEATNSQQQQELTDLRQQLAEQQQHNARLQQQLAEQQQQNARLQQDVADLQQQLAGQPQAHTQQQHNAGLQG